MTKIVIIAGVALGVILVSVILLSVVAPRKISVRNIQFINAPKQVVFDQIRYMKNFTDWSPFKVQDPQQKSSVTGKDGEVGATFHWEGVKEKSKGSQTIVSLKGSDEVKLLCTITEPFRSTATFSYTLVEKNGGVEVVQNFNTEMPIPANIFGMLLRLKDKMSATNKQGLQLLGAVSEKKAAVSLHTY
jgi:hypothetical protein